jgi:diguanylate cyclase (GGDEF)-like protein
MPDMIFLLDWQGTYLDYKAGYGSAPYVGTREVINRHVSEVLPTEVADLLLHAIERALLRGELQSVVYKLPMPDGTHHYEARVAPSGVDRVVAVVRDITLQKLNEEKIRRLAYFDTLTGMPNRQNFVERLDGQLLHARREHHQVALLFLHLDDSKRVNDTLGHTAGDYLLHAVADRLKEKLRGSDFIARPALDETGVHFARLDGDAIKRLALENDLREGLEHDEFRLVYQPQVLAEGGAIESILMDTDPSRIEGLARLRAQGCISRWTTSAPATCHCPASSASRSAC